MVGLKCLFKTTEGGRKKSTRYIIASCLLVKKKTEKKKTPLARGQKKPEATSRHSAHEKEKEEKRNTRNIQLAQRKFRGHYRSHSRGVFSKCFKEGRFLFVKFYLAHRQKKVRYPDALHIRQGKYEKPHQLGITEKKKQRHVTHLIPPHPTPVLP